MYWWFDVLSILRFYRAMLVTRMCLQTKLLANRRNDIVVHSLFKEQYK